MSDAPEIALVQPTTEAEAKVQERACHRSFGVVTRVQAGVVVGKKMAQDIQQSISPTYCLGASCMRWSTRYGTCLDNVVAAALAKQAALTPEELHGVLA